MPSPRACAHLYISGWGLGPEQEPRAQASEVQANPGSELEVRTGGQHGGGGLHLTRPPPPPPQWHHKARSHIQPVLQLTPRQRRGFLSTAPGRPRRPPKHCGGRGEGAAGQVPTPERGRGGRSPSPNVLLDLRWAGGRGGGWAGAPVPQEEASSV